jgi:FdhD protein
MWRSVAGRAPTTHEDVLAGEEPLEIRVAGTPVSVTMRTPGHDRELAVGFLLSEGLIASRDDLADVRQAAGGAQRNVIDVRPVPGVGFDLTHLTRHVFASSSCGLCGKATIEAVHQRLAPITADVSVDADVLLALPERLRAAQPDFARTGGLHAAALFDTSGRLLLAREDIGRHNAVDKVLGAGLLAGALPVRAHVLLVSGRASFEIVQKALAGGVPIVAAVSAPSSLAVTLAAESKQTLVGFLRPPHLNVYTHPERIRFHE